MQMDMISLAVASRESGIPYVTLKAAARRYHNTSGASGLESVKPEGSRDWFTTRPALDKFKETYHPHLKLRKPIP